MSEPNSIMQAVSVGEWGAILSILAAGIVGIFRGGLRWQRIQQQLLLMDIAAKRNEKDHDDIRKMLMEHQTLLARGVPPPEVREALDDTKARLQRIETKCG
jgi:hypothetical protein